MLDDLKEEAIVNKVGGRFKLSTLIQKRMIMLNTGAKPLVDLRTNDKMAIVVAEILADKIYLDTNNNVQTRNENAIINDSTVFHRAMSVPTPTPPSKANSATSSSSMSDSDE